MSANTPDRILITGGMGFIGQHTVRALLDLGRSCVATSHRTARRLELVGEEHADRISVERLDLAERGAVLALGERHQIAGIVHLADPGLAHLADPDLSSATLIEDFRRGANAILNIVEAASLWKARVIVASTIGVYGGLEQMRGVREDVPLSMSADGNPVAASKKAAEVLGTFLAPRAGVQLAIARLPAVWGPLGRPTSRFFGAPALVHAAAANAALDASDPIYADDGIDMLYARDCGRALALLQTAEQLRHSTYNVGSGHATSNRDVAAAVKRAAPDARADLQHGRDPGHSVYLDTARLRGDTGFEPRFDLDAAVADYLAWLRAGHDR